MEGVEIKRCRYGSASCKPHVHHELSIGCILRGSTELTLRDETLHFTAGDGVIIPPMATHRCAPHDVAQWEYCMLFVPPGYYADAVHFPAPRRLTGPQARTLRRYIDRLLAEPCPDTAETTLLEMLLAFGETAPGTQDTDAQAVRQAHAYIASHVYETITLERLEPLFGLNKFTLIRQFKQLYLTTPAAFHLQCRVAEAKRLLGLNRDVFAVCEALHFYDQAHLIRELKKMYGITPAAYQEQIRQ